MGYVPRIAADHLLSIGGPLTSAHDEQRPCAVLFADISGFTALTERLAEEGPEGVETLTSVLNDYFGRMVNAIEAHGGDVVKFAGDALLALWPTSSTSDLHTLTLIATQCAVQIQSELRDYTAAGGERLSLKVAVGSGTVRAFRIGGVFRRWEFAVCGDPINQVEVVNSACGPGDVGLSATARATLGESVTTSPLPLDCHQVLRLTHEIKPTALEVPVVKQDDIGTLKSLIPAAIHQRLEAGQSVWLAELRRISVLFVNLPGLTAETPIEEAHQAMRTLQTALYSYEGSVNKLSVDDKGVSLIAALGLPPLAHKDDPRRAALAALAMHKDLADLGWASSIGVTTGRVFCGTIGNDRRREYTIMGDTVNLSARLMQAANGGILCDAATQSQALQFVDFEPLDAIFVKGKDAAIEIFEPRGERVLLAHGDAELGFIGRRSERAELVQAFDALRAGAGRAAIVEGAPGVGKSRFAEELARAAVGQDIRVMRGAAAHAQRTTPYFAWSPVLRQLLGLALSDSTSTVESKILAHASTIPELVWLAPLLNSVLLTEFAATGLTAQMESEARRDALLSLCVELMERLCDQEPALVLIEDGQWLDDASWLLLERVATAAPWVMVVVITRALSDPLPVGFVALTEDPSTVMVTLAPLDREEALALAKERLGVRAIKVDLADLILERTQGNPFFLEALLDSLKSSGQVRVQDNAAELAYQPDADASLPTSLEALVVERLDRLPPSIQLTLKVASVIGQVIDLQLLRAVYPVEAGRDSLESQVQELCELGLFSAPDETHEGIEFRNNTVRDVTYNLMLFSHRRSLHAAVALWLEAHQSEISGALALLAHHWHQADDTAKTLHYCNLAGIEAASNFANREAVEFFSRVLELDASNPAVDRIQRATWEEALGNAYYSQGDFGASLIHLERALLIFDRALPMTERKLRGRLVCEVVGQLRRLVSKNPSRASDPLMESASRVYTRLGQLHYLNNNKARGIFATLRGLNLAIDSGSRLEKSRQYANMTVVAGLVRLNRLAAIYARRAIANAERTKDNGARAYVLNIVGLYWATQAKWTTASKNLSAAQELASRMGHHRRWEETAVVQVMVLYRRGELHASRNLARRLYKSGRQRAVKAVQVWGLTAQLAADIALENDDRELHSRLAQLLGNILPKGDRIFARGVLALSALRQGDVSQAEQFAEQAEALMSQVDTTAQYVLGGYASVAEVGTELWARGDRDQFLAQRLTDAACKALKQYACFYPVGVPQYRRFNGRRWWLQGRKSKALKEWQSGVEIAASMGMVYEQGCLHMELAEHGSDASATAQRAAALDCFTQARARSGDAQQLENITRSVLWM